MCSRRAKQHKSSTGHFFILFMPSMHSFKPPSTSINVVPSYMLPHTWHDIHITEKMTSGLKEWKKEPWIYKEYINIENQTLKSHFVGVLGDFFFVPPSTKPLKKSNLNFSKLGTYYLLHHLIKRILVL